MIQAAPEVAFTAVSTLIGWTALWPLRRQLGPAVYVAGFPVGLLSWSMVWVSCAALGRSLDLVSAGAGVLTFVLSLWVVASAFTRGEGHASKRPSLLGYAIAATVILIASTALALSRLTIATGDSWGAYWPLGLHLARQGVTDISVIASRGIPLISISAANAILGSRWAYVVYPMMSLHVVAILLMLWHSGPFSALDGRRRVSATLVLLGSLVLTPTFLYMSLYVHSHMISAMYLLGSCGALWIASRGVLTGESISPAWLVVAGVSAAGFALSRPDGLAYIFVPIIAAASILTRGEARLRRTLAFFAPMLLLVYAIYVTAYLRFGMWPAEKLDGWMSLAILAAIGGSAALPVVARAGEVRLPERLRGLDLSVIVLLGGLTALVCIAALDWQAARVALLNAWANLMGGQGAWGYFWWSVVLLLSLTVLAGDALRPRSWSRLIFSMILLFFVIAGLVHITQHTGRLGTGDSLNRAVFHVVPVVWWYFALVWGRIVGSGFRVHV